jgi:hypothetical protein
VRLPFAISQSVFAGTADYIALSFKTFGHESGFFWYISGCLGISPRWSSQMAMVDMPAGAELDRLSRIQSPKIS